MNLWVNKRQQMNLGYIYKFGKNVIFTNELTMKVLVNQANELTF